MSLFDNTDIDLNTDELAYGEANNIDALASDTDELVLDAGGSGRLELKRDKNTGGYSIGKVTVKSTKIGVMRIENPYHRTKNSNGKVTIYVHKGNSVHKLSNDTYVHYLSIKPGTIFLFRAEGSYDKVIVSVQLDTYMHFLNLNKKSTKLNLKKNRPEAIINVGSTKTQTIKFKNLVGKDQDPTLVEVKRVNSGSIQLGNRQARPNSKVQPGTRYIVRLKKGKKAQVGVKIDP